METIENKVEKYRQFLESQQERRAEIQKLRAEGKTLQAIGAQFGITRQRVWQILHVQPADPEEK